MKKLFLLFTTLAWAQVAAAAESTFIDDAHKGFIHITAESFGADVHHYLRANSVIHLQQFPEEEADKIRARKIELLSAKD